MNIPAIENRRSIRKFRKDAVPAESVQQILHAATLAPSAKNDQPWEFLIIGPDTRASMLGAMEAELRGLLAQESHPQSRARLSSALHSLRVMKSAPVLIGVVRPDSTHPRSEISGTERVLELLDVMSVGAAIENMLLEACALGLGTLWIGNTFQTYDTVCDTLAVNGQLLSIIAVGFPDEAPAPRPRKPMESVIHELP